MTNPDLIVCRPCWEVSLKRADTDKFKLIQRLSEKFKHEPIKTVAIVRTKEKGLLTWRPAGDTGGLAIVEFISFVQGVAI